MNSAAVQFNITWPKEDVERLFRAMESARKYLNYDVAHALKSAARYVVQALGTSTKVAPKYRDISPSNQPAPRRDLKAFDVTGWFGAPRRPLTKTVFSRNLSTAKRRHATIGKRGLAKAVWGASSRYVGGYNVLVTAASSVSRLAAKFADTTSRLSGDAPSIEINNFLPYAEDALQGGPKDVGAAMERAARGLEKSVEKQLVKRMGLGRLS